MAILAFLRLILLGSISINHYFYHKPLPGRGELLEDTVSKELCEPEVEDIAFLTVLEPDFPTFLLSIFNEGGLLNFLKEYISDSLFA